MIVCIFNVSKLPAMKKMGTLSLCLLIASLLNAQQPTTLQEVKADSVAQKLLQFFAVKQADSAYTLAGASFKKALPYSKWVDVCEKQLYGLLPFKNVEFKRSKNGANKYKMEGVVPLQLFWA